MQVLFVEDDEITRDIIASVLRGRMTLRSVSSGDEAMALLGSGYRPDLLLTDIQLPGNHDGWAVARAFQERHRSLPVVYLTASRSAADPVRHSVFLMKPVKPALLVAAIEACLGRRFGGEPATAERRRIGHALARRPLAATAHGLGPARGRLS